MVENVCKIFTVICTRYTYSVLFFSNGLYVYAFLYPALFSSHRPPHSLTADKAKVKSKQPSFSKLCV